MQYSFDLTRKAEEDADSAYYWYELQRKGLGMEFFEALHSAFSSIKSNPLLYSFRKDNIRGCIVKGFPYTVLFHVTKSHIRVTAVFHFSRKPNA